MENIDINKDVRQRKIVDKWRQARGIGTAECVPGFGKTRIGLLIIDGISQKYADLPILILVPSAAIKDHWEKEISKEFSNTIIAHCWILSAQDAIFDVELYKQRFSLVIVDEIHKFTSPERYKLFTKFIYSFILGLTGTYPIGKEKKMLDKHCPVIDRVLEKEALENGYISNFREYNIACTLSDEDKERYEKFSEPISETLGLFKGLSRKITRNGGEPLFRDDYQIIQACYSGLKTKDVLGQSFYVKAETVRQLIAEKMGWSVELDLSLPYNQDRNTYWNPLAIKQRAHNFNDFVRRRNDIIINNKVKEDKVLEIFKRFPATTICFNESTDFATKIANSINQHFGKDSQIAIAYHSSIESIPIWDVQLGDFIRYSSGQKKGEIKMFGKKTMYDIAIDGLRNGEFTFLSTARALDEGVDIPNIQNVITTAGTANPTQYEQRKGRGTRVDVYNPDKITKIFNLYFDDFIGSTGNIVHSRDKQKLISKQSERKSTVIWVNDLDEISE